MTTLEELDAINNRFKVGGELDFRRPGDARKVVMGEGIGGFLKGLFGDDESISIKLIERYPGAKIENITQEDGHVKPAIRLPDTDDVPEEIRGRALVFNEDGLDIMDVSRFGAQSVLPTVASAIATGGMSIPASIARQAAGQVVAGGANRALGGADVFDPGAMIADGVLGGGGEAGMRAGRSFMDNTVGRGANLRRGKEDLEGVFGTSEGVSNASLRTHGRNVRNLGEREGRYSFLQNGEKLEKSMAELEAAMGRSRDAAFSNRRMTASQIEGRSKPVDAFPEENKEAFAGTVLNRYPDSASDTRQLAEGIREPLRREMNRRAEAASAKYDNQSGEIAASVRGRQVERRLEDGSTEVAQLGPESVVFTGDTAPGRMRAHLKSLFSERGDNPSTILDEKQVAEALEGLAAPGETGIQFVRLRTALRNHRDSPSASNGDRKGVKIMLKELDEMIEGSLEPELGRAWAQIKQADDAFREALAPTGLEPSKGNDSIIDRSIRRLFDPKGPNADESDLGKLVLDEMINQQNRAPNGNNAFTERLFKMAEEILPPDELKTWKETVKSSVMANVLQGKEGVTGLTRSPAAISKTINSAVAPNSPLLPMLEAVGVTNDEILGLRALANALERTTLDSSGSLSQALSMTAGGGPLFASGQGLSLGAAVQRTFRGLGFYLQLKERGLTGMSGVVGRPGMMGGAVGGAMSPTSTETMSQERLEEAMRRQHGGY